jgi:predicted RNA-binding Zn-ribbon protein involved in translation (DUF1610 family)
MKGFWKVTILPCSRCRKVWFPERNQIPMACPDCGDVLTLPSTKRKRGVWIKAL